MITSGEEFLSSETLTNIAYHDIPFPLKRVITYNEKNTWITIIVDYAITTEQLRVFNSNNP